MDLRSRQDDSALRQHSRFFSARRGHVLAWAAGVMVALAACGQATTRVPGGDPAVALGSLHGSLNKPSASASPGGSNAATPESRGSLTRSARLGGPGTASPGTPGSSPTATSRSSATPSPSATPRPAPPGTRNKLLWPFASTSIWNMPIGRGAVYVPAQIAPPTIQSLTSDQDIIVMDPSAPLVGLLHSGAGWSGGSRCTGTGSALASVPIPSNFTVSSNGHNDALAVLMPDGQTVPPGQPFALRGGGVGTLLGLAPSDNLYGSGIFRRPRRLGLNSLGGTIRLNHSSPVARSVTSSRSTSTRPPTSSPARLPLAGDPP